MICYSDQFDVTATTHHVVAQLLEAGRDLQETHVRRQPGTRTFF
jgi:hypothetical protein